MMIEMGKRNWNFNIVGSVGQFPNYTIPTPNTRRKHQVLSSKPTLQVPNRHTAQGLAAVGFVTISSIFVPRSPEYAL